MARIGVLLVVVALGLTVSPAFFWMLWFAIPFTTGGERQQHARWGCGGGHRHADHRSGARTGDEGLVRA